MQPYFSIIIPTYASTAYIEKCLLSIKTQIILTPGVKFEILLGIDHCEKSRTFIEKILPDFSNTRVFYFNEHVGPYIIRNTLAKISTGECIVFFDSDDIMPPGFLKGVLSRLKTNDMVLFYHKNFIDVVDNAQTSRVTDFKRIELFKKANAINYETYVTKTSIYNNIKKTIKNGNVFRKKFYVNFINRTFDKNLNISALFAIKRETFLTLNGYRPWPIAADSEFIMRAKANHISQAYINKRFAFLKRVHTESLTLNHKYGMGSKIRNEYRMISKKSIYESKKMVTTSNYIEITRS